MKLIIDDADCGRIRTIMEYYPADGVTTNPSILAKSGRPPYEVLREIRKLIGTEGELHVQVLSADADRMVKEASSIRCALGENTFVKVPVTKEGLKAIRTLSNAGVHVTATAIYTTMQAFLAAKAGACYAAPYVNRIDNLGADGVATALQINRIFRENALPCELLAASFKNAQQIMALCAEGVGAVTASPDVIEQMLKNENVTAAVAAFTHDFEGLCGTGKTMANCG